MKHTTKIVGFALTLLSPLASADPANTAPSTDSHQQIVAAYAQAIKTCTPGTYKYTVSAPSKGTGKLITVDHLNVISGMQGGKCVIDETATYVNRVVKTHCTLSDSSRKYMSEMYLPEASQQSDSQKTGQTSDPNSGMDSFLSWAKDCSGGE